MTNIPLKDITITPSNIIEGNPSQVVDEYPPTSPRNSEDDSDDSGNASNHRQ